MRGPPGAAITFYPHAVKLSPGLYQKHFFGGMREELVLESR